jgi:hypothetical protein
MQRAQTMLYVHESMEPFTEYLLDGYRQVVVKDDFSPSGVPDTRQAWFVSEGAVVFQEGLNFASAVADRAAPVLRRLRASAVEPGCVRAGMA